MFLVLRFLLVSYVKNKRGASFRSFKNLSMGILASALQTFCFCLFEFYLKKWNIYIQCTSPLKKCWNFKAVFRRNSTRISEVNIWNHSGILMEFHWNTIGILPPILSKFTACFPELFRWNTTHFLAERTGILMEFLWYFDGILVVFWWNSSQKNNAKGLTCRI